MHSALESIQGTMTRLHELHPRISWRLMFGASLVELEGNLGLFRKSRVWNFNSLRLSSIPEIQIRNVALAMADALTAEELAELKRAGRA
jgi:hypothetical protein